MMLSPQTFTIAPWVLYKIRKRVSFVYTKGSGKTLSFYAGIRFTRQTMRQHRFLHKIVLQEMKRRLYIPSMLPPLKTVANGYEYYSTTSAYGMVYLRKKLGEGNHAPEVNMVI
jgi:hypothetical protein